MYGYKTYVYWQVATFIAVVSAMFQCKEPANTVLATHPNGMEYAGADACMSCHAQQYEQHRGTAHYSSSHLFAPSTMDDLFESGHNKFDLSDSISYTMVKVGDKFYQQGFYGDSLVESKPFDITIGSGKRGQTYLYWEEELLYQLPVSHYTASNSWVNSPGYSTDVISFNREVKPACMECHSTYMESKDDIFNRKNRYSKNEVVLGISCERCHGPAKKHADFHEDNSNEKEPQFITKQANLTRQQKLHACALCHSGPGVHTKEPFDFLTGGTLEKLVYEKYEIEKNEKLDVHANQYGLLTVSKCFINSPKMDCSTCHNVHENQSNKTEIFSAKCMKCHAESGNMDCGLRASKRSDLNENCIDCHMPNLETANISILKPNQKGIFSTIMRTHRIGIYTDNLDGIKAYIESNY